MKLHLTIEYDVMGDEESHKRLLEHDPLEFINSIWNLNNTQFEYCLESSQESCDSEFDCELYFYNNVEGNICKKYGALCSNFLCKSVK